MAGIAAKVTVEAVRDRRTRQRIVTLIVGGFVGVLLLLLVLASVIGGTSPTTGGAAPASAEALADIPPAYLALYQQAGAERGIDWSVLAGIGKVECDHGRSELPGCPRDTANRCGARGPMQFLGNTWRRDTDPVPSGDCPGSSAFTADPTGEPTPEGDEAHGYATDANGDGVADPWEPADAIHAAARLLNRNRAPDDIRAALRAYNNDQDYVETVLDYARRYSATPTDTPAGFTGTPGDVPVATVNCPGGGSTTVHAQLTPAVEALYADAAAAGHLLCGGGYRTPDQQIETRRQNCGDSDYAIYRMPSSECSPPTARPGTSRHERGLAIDFTCDGTLIRTRDNPCSDWLEANAVDYGLAPLASEPWHYSIDGR